MIERTNDQWVADLQQTGDVRQQALEDLRQRLVRGLLFYLSHDRSDLAGRAIEELQQMVDDFVQEALLKILDNLPSFRGESQFTTWASKIATRIAISELRRARWKDYSLDEITVEGETLSLSRLPGILSAQSPRPEQQIEQQSTLSLIDQAIQETLTDRQRIALTAYAIDELPIEEVARLMGTNRNALYKLIHDARLKLKQTLEEQGLSIEYLATLFENG